MFIDGFLALCPTVGVGACTEPTATNYYRQPISFARSINGVSVSSIPFNFGQAVSSAGPFAGRAVFDAPAGGNLLLVLPFPAPRTLGGRIPDAGDVGTIRLLFDALAAYPNGDAYSGSFAASAAVGQTYDELALRVPWTIQVDGGHYVPNANLTPITAGVALTITRGILRAT